MAAHSKIEWTNASWNPIRALHQYVTHDPSGGDPEARIGWHCEKVSEACRNCYAEAMNKRLGTSLAYKPESRKHAEIVIDEKTLLAPLHWRKPKKIFVCSMTDVFAEWVTDELLDSIFAVMALCPQQTFQVLTKRPERMREYFANFADDEWLPQRIQESANQIAWAVRGEGRFADESPEWPLPNVWLGVTAENQATADARIPALLDTPAAVRWVSIEPMLSEIDIRPYMPNRLWNDIPSWKQPELDWIVCGGESGPNARPMHPDWARSLRDQCAAAGVPFFFKQMTKKAPIPGDLLVREFPNA